MDLGPDPYFGRGTPPIRLRLRSRPDLDDPATAAARLLLGAALVGQRFDELVRESSLRLRPIDARVLLLWRETTHPMNCADVAALLGVSRTTAAGALDRLRAEGLTVSRCESNRGSVHPNARGRSVERRLDEHLRVALSEVVDGDPGTVSLPAFSTWSRSGWRRRRAERAVVESRAQ
jgi:hypothetical protein